MSASPATEREAIARVLDAFFEADRIASKAALLLPLEDTMAAGVRRGFRRQGTAFLRRFESLRGTFAESRLREADDAAPAWEPLWDEAAPAGHAELTAAANAGAEAALLAGGKAVVASLGVETSFDLANPAAVRYLDRYAADLVTGIDETTRDRLNSLITGGVQQGMSYEKVAATLRDQFDNWAEPQAFVRDRAELVSITEIGNAYEYAGRGVVDGLVAAGLDYEKSWLAEGDACPLCADNADEGWIPLDSDFSSGAQQPCAHPACRCTTLYRRVGSDSTAGGASSAE